MIEIKTQKIKDSEVSVPGSKSYTHRTLIAAALSDGRCHIKNILRSDDTVYTMGALKQMGVMMDEQGNDVIVNGTAGRLKPCSYPVYLGNSGTSMRLLTGVSALGRGTYTLTGTQRMKERPIDDLLDGLRQIHISAHSVNNKDNRCPPIEVKGGNVEGGHVDLKCHVSSQYLSSLLLIAPYTKNGLDITVVKGPVSRPYIDMTVDIMERFGAEVNREGYERFHVPGGQLYRSGTYMVEPDCSQASYFWAAAALTGARIKIKGIKKDSRQGDVRFAEVLESMGCHVSYENDGIAVSGGNLSAIDVDMADMPDVVPTLSVVAAFAKGTTIIRNVAHLKEKESDRLTAVATELSKMGVTVGVTDTGLEIVGGHAGPAEINTYDDHRIAMSFAVAGILVPGIRIKDEHCVEKSFPDYWDVFGKLYE